MKIEDIEIARQTSKGMLVTLKNGNTYLISEGIVTQVNPDDGSLYPEIVVFNTLEDAEKLYYKIRECAEDENNRGC